MNFVLIFYPFYFTNVLVTVTPREKVGCGELKKGEVCLKFGFDEVDDTGVFYAVCPHDSDFDIIIETKFFWQKDYEKF